MLYYLQAYKLSNHLVLDLLRSNGINQITIQPEFPQCCDEQNEEDPGDGLKTLIQPQVQFHNLIIVLHNDFMSVIN